MRDIQIILNKNLSIADIELHPISIGDFEIVFKWFSNYRITKYLQYKRTQSIENAKVLTEHFVEKGIFVPLCTFD